MTPSYRPVRTVALPVVATLALLASCAGPKGGRVGLIGDSITDLSQQTLHGTLDGSYEVELVGHFGARADQVVPEAKVIAASHPRQAIINLGTNDAIQQVPPAQTAKAVQEMVTALADSRCVFLVEINEAITAHGQPRTAEARAINEQLRKIADRAPNGRMIEWNDDIADNGGPEQITYDTVHLSQKGLLILAKAYQKALDSC